MTGPVGRSDRGLLLLFFFPADLEAKTQFREDLVKLCLRDGRFRVQDAAALDEARRTVEPFREEIEALDYYQRSGLWQQDFEADEAGKLPSGIRRSVLSEDGLYNLLETIGTLYQS